MRRLVLAFSTVLLLLSAPAPATALAEDRFGIGLKAGSYGLGGEFGVRLIDRVALRLSVSRFDASADEDISGINYNGDLSVGGEGLLVDVYPLGGKFRVTAGIYNNRNEVDLVGTPTAPVEVGGTIYPPSVIGTLSSTVDFGDTTPYFGIGWGNVAHGESRFGLLFDAGVLTQDVGTVRLTSSAGLIPQNDLDQEAAKIQDDISDYDIWPVLSFGLAIRF